MRVLDGRARFLPPELRRQIAQHCDKATLTQLALVHALWASECEPVLYVRIGLCIGNSTADNDATYACLHTLSGSARKAAMVRALLVWYTPYEIALRDDNAAAFDNSEPLTRRVYETIPCLYNLVDLRIRATDDVHSKIMCHGLVDALAGGKPRISLRTLHIPCAYDEHGMQLEKILRAQSATLRLLALHEWFPTYHSFGWYIGNPVLNKDCVVFLIGDNAIETDYDTVLLHSTEPESITAVVRSLEMDPPLPPHTGAPNFDLDSFRAIQLRADAIPDAARMSLLARCFPHCTRLTLTATKNPAVLLNPAGIAQSVAHFPHVEGLSLSCSRKELTLAPLDVDLRVSIARAAVAAGCTELQDVSFPDDTGLSREEGSDVWRIT